jgi:hypothetical protein
MRTSSKVLTAVAAALLLAAATRPAAAHCDSMQAAVIAAGRAALASGDLEPALRWVAPADADEVRAAFTAARAAVGLDAGARLRAEGHFFETLLRLHRAGHGHPRLDALVIDLVARLIAPALR